jgi:hypothetical protein
MLIVIPPPPPGGFRCRSCRSRRYHVDILRSQLVKARIVHKGSCAARWNMTVRLVVEHDFLAFLDGQHVRTAQYNEDKPVHKFVDVAI